VFSAARRLHGTQSSYKPTWAHPDICTLQLSPLYHRD